MFLRAQVVNLATAIVHVGDLYNIIANDGFLLKKPVLMLLSNNGPVFNPKSLLNTIYFYKLFKGVLRRNIEHFLKKSMQEKLRTSEMKWLKNFFFFFQSSIFLIFVKIWIPVFPVYFLVDKSMT